MKNFILIAIFITIAMFVLVASILFERERKRRISRYWIRSCTGGEWRRRFPQIPKDKIREFLYCFVDGFAFKREKRLNFSPDDKVMDVYRALYPSEGWPDALELETFAKNLEKKYGFDLSRVKNPNVRLGELFKMVIKGNPNKTIEATS